MAQPFSISLGHEWNIWKDGRKGGRVVYDGERHLTLFGPNGSGKGVCLEIPNLLRLKGLSIINIDPKGQNVSVTRRWRSTVSECVVLNPLDVLGIGSAGVNPLGPAQRESLAEVGDGAKALHLDQFGAFPRLSLHQI